MRQYYIVLLLFIMLSFDCSLNQSQDVFTLIEIPSSYHDPTILSKQIQWIQENIEREQIDFVIHAGDIVPLPYMEDDWIAISQLLHQLDDIVPYFVLTGNHDLFPGTGPNRARNDSLYHKYFPIAAKQNYTAFRGSHPIYSDNAYFLIGQGEFKLFLLCLEFAPREEILEWANGVLSDHDDYQMMIATHCFTRSTDTINNYSWAPVFLNPENKDREAIWELLVKRHKNIFLVSSFHFKGCRREASLGDHGNVVHQLLANYVTEDVRDGGWLRILKIDLQRQELLVRTYSPIKNEFSTDSRDQFELFF